MDWLGDNKYGLNRDSCHDDYSVYDEIIDFIKNTVDNEVIFSQIFVK